jgi:2'-5' RNA ligase
VNGLYSTIHKAMRRLDMAPRREVEIAPHMTLIYDRAEAAETVVEPVKWRVEEFVLIHAVHGEGRFDVMGRFPLQA